MLFADVQAFSRVVEEKTGSLWKPFMEEFLNYVKTSEHSFSLIPGGTVFLRFLNLRKKRSNLHWI